MLKQTFAYTDYNGESDQATLYFNINKDEMFDLLPLKPRIEGWLERISGPKRELTQEEVLDFYDIIRTLIDLSYGERSENGKEFAKSKKILKKFKQSAAYGAYIFSLFENAELGMNFMVEIMPADLVKAAKLEVAQSEGSPGTNEIVSLPSVDEKPAERKFEDYSEEELLAMSQQEFENLVGKDPKKWPREVMFAAYQRKNAFENVDGSDNA